MNGKISIIVPVYKVEEYLDACVQSLLNQTWPDLEIILVDDGSPDTSGSLCEKYAVIDSRVRVLHQENGGLSAARNSGLALAEGDYIAFIDSDDWIDPDMMESMLEALEKEQADIALCGWHNEIEKSTVQRDEKEDPPALPDQLPPEGTFTAREALAKLSEPGGVAFVIACNRLARRKIYEDFRFPEGKLHEDEFTAHILLSRAEKIVALARPFYHYRRHGGTITGSAGSIRRLDGAQALAERFGFFEEQGMAELLQPAFQGFMSCYITAIRDLRPKNDEEKARLEEMAAVGRDLLARSGLEESLSKNEKLALEKPEMWIRLFHIKQTLKKVKR
ncbi:MAG: glycosyltransferase [Lachnospiraceae bacterium]|nr:glycosyltransferase [Lachnospiraceae bacterium]